MHAASASGRTSCLSQTSRRVCFGQWRTSNGCSSDPWLDYAAALSHRKRASLHGARIESVLQAEGFTRWDDIEWDDDHWEVDDAIGADGREYDLELDASLAIIERDPD